MAGQGFGQEPGLVRNELTDKTWPWSCIGPRLQLVGMRIAIAAAWDRRQRPCPEGAVAALDTAGPGPVPATATEQIFAKCMEVEVRLEVRQRVTRTRARARFLCRGSTVDQYSGRRRMWVPAGSGPWSDRDGGGVADGIRGTVGEGWVDVMILALLLYILVIM